jgi:hypothetical protein
MAARAGGGFVVWSIAPHDSIGCLIFRKFDSSQYGGAAA